MYGIYNIFIVLFSKQSALAQQRLVRECLSVVGEHECFDDKTKLRSYVKQIVKKTKKTTTTTR